MLFSTLVVETGLKLCISSTTGMLNSRSYVGRIGEILAVKFAASRNLDTKKVKTNKNKSSLELFG